MKQVQRSITVQLDSDIEIRTETLLGKEYTVVPVVAMVEGVRFGANQSDPELGLAEEFGDTPILWANRPLVLNHPKINGSFVSANSPEVLESYMFGLTMNPYIDGDKLKMEAWIDHARVEELGGDFESTLKRITDLETVEVSVGFFSDLEAKKGKFNGQSYSGVWRNIRPDHLAILDEGSTGACSVKDGCGIPRINKREDKMAKTPKTLNTAAPKTNCSCGGHDHKTDASAEEIMEIEAFEGFVPSETDPAYIAAQARLLIRTNNKGIVDHELGLDVQSVDANLLSSDVSKLISMALRKKFGGYSYMYGYNANYAIYESYSDVAPYGYVMKKIGINISNDTVTFVGEPTEVILLTRMVDLEQNPVVLNTPIVNTQENDMADDKNKKVEDKTVAVPEVAVVPEVQAAPILKEAAAVVVAPVVHKVLTAQEYADAAPAEIREILQAGLKANADKKATAIASIKANASNRFTDEYLATLNLDVLEGMVALSAPSYRGVATPTTVNPVVQANQAPEAPVLFPVKAA